MSPQDKFWQVTVNLTGEDEKGKIKTEKEVHLVDAFDVKAVEAKVKEMMDGEDRDWEISSVILSKVIEVY